MTASYMFPFLVSLSASRASVELSEQEALSVYLKDCGIASSEQLKDYQLSNFAFAQGNTFVHSCSEPSD